MTGQPPRPGKPVFVIKVQPVRADCGDGIRGLRWILKTLLRRHGFRCTAAYEDQSSNTETIED
jgi:hypothetical protein